MITFSCRKNESIVIDNGIIVTVLDIQGAHVELGIEYPDGNFERRSELLEAVCQTAGSWEPGE